MTECGSVPDNSCPFGVLSYLCSQFCWGEYEYTFASYLIETGGPINFPPRTRIGKRNMQGLVLREEDCKLFDIMITLTLHSNYVCSDQLSGYWKDHSP